MWKGVLTNSSVRCFGLLNNICYQSPLLIKFHGSVFEVCVSDSTYPQRCLSWLLLNLLFFSHQPITAASIDLQLLLAGVSVCGTEIECRQSQLS